MTPSEEAAGPPPAPPTAPPSQEGGAPAPVGPPPRRARSPQQRLVAFLTSPTLAIAILVVVLLCCLVGVTLVRGARAGELIFATLWFNGLLVLLAISSATAFFTRIWKRRLTTVSVGMIIFHLSFAALLGGVVYDSLFFFQGVLRLTEGETLPNDQPESYDQADHGRFFDYGRLRGETTLVRMHTGYKVDGDDKRAAYEIAVWDGASRVQRVIYVTEYLDFGGVRFFCMKEGYSVLLVMTDRQGRERAGAHVPLQSYKQGDGTYLYASGSAAEPGGFPFPPPPEAPQVGVKLTYWPSQVERAGQVGLVAWPVDPGKAGEAPPAQHQGLVPLGGRVEAGEVSLSPREIRYWVGMNVRYDPGLNVVLASLCLGLVGMVITFVGRLRQGPGRKRAAAN